MLQTYFETLTDERQAWKVKHNLLEIVVMTICAVIAGCDAWEDIEDFCRVKEQWLKENLHLELKNGLPSHDTMQRVWSMIHPEEFETCFSQWASSVCQRTDGEIVSIDGKTVRRSKDTDKNPIHMVSAWANQNQMVLGQLATDEKSNEITAVPELLEALDITGTIITTDAMSCQKEIVKKIIEKQADYTIALKKINLHCTKMFVTIFLLQSLKSNSIRKFPPVRQQKKDTAGLNAALTIFLQK